MSRHPQLYQWIDTVVMRFPSLSKPQALGLALWSFGMIIARSCSLPLWPMCWHRSWGSPITRCVKCVILTWKQVRKLEISASNSTALSVGHMVGLAIGCKVGKRMAITMDGELGIFCGTGYQCCVSRLCRTSCLESFKSRGETTPGSRNGRRC